MHNKSVNLFVYELSRLLGWGKYTKITIPCTSVYLDFTTKAHGQLVKGEDNVFSLFYLFLSFLTLDLKKAQDADFCQNINR